MSAAALPFAPPPPAKGERIGLIAALALHVALLGALSLSWGSPPAPPPAEPEPITVSLVKDVAPTATAPPAPVPPAPSVAPDQGEPEDAAPPPPAPEPVKPSPKPEPVKAAPKPEPVKPAPKPAPVKAEPKPAEKAEPKPKPAPVKPAPAEKPKAAKPAAAKPVEKPAPAKAAEQPAKARPSRLAGLGQELAAGAKADATHARGHKLGADFLSGLAADAPAKKASAAAPAAKAGPFPAASIAQAIARQIQPCADRQVDPGPGANEIVTVLNIRLNEDGTLAATPRIVRQSGLTDENNRYAQRVADLGTAAFKGCTPLHLPAEYFQTAGGGGWNNINYRWQLK